MRTMNVSCLKKEFQYCMHACGFIHDLMFTNSRESLEYWYGQGIRLFEVDIDVACDGMYVACHNFNKETFEKMELEEIPEQCTGTWFRQQKLYPYATGGLTPLTLDDIFGLLQRYPDLLFMIDPKIYSYDGTCALLEKMRSETGRAGIDGKRILFETYNEDMIRATEGYREVFQYQYCVDDEMQMGSSEMIRSWEMERLVRFLKTHNIFILSWPWKFAVESLEKLKRLKEEGFVIFSKTRNDILQDLLKRAGINVNIIDHLVTDAQKKELEHYRKTYFEAYEGRINRVFGAGK